MPLPPSDDNYSLSGRVALVTGGGVGIGRAVALALAQAGAAVGIHYHSSVREAEETARHVRSAFFVIRQAIPHLRGSGKGSIINNLTLSVQTGGSGGAGPYAAAKGALQVLTRTLARELAPEVRTNAIMPGVIETPHHERF